MADAGAHVKKGDVIAAFDRENMLNRLDDFETTVRQSQSRIKKLQGDLEVNHKSHQQLIAVAKAEYDKARLDYQKAAVVSAIEAERFKLAMEEAEAKHKQLLQEVRHVETSLRAQMRVAEINMAQANSELRRAQANLDRLLVKAPMAGIVVLYTTWRGGEMTQIKQGDAVGAGQTFMKVVDTSSMILESRVNQVDAEKIRVGQRATVRFDAYPDLRLPARVYAVGAMASASGFLGAYVKEIPVRLKLEALDPRVIPDLSVSVDLVLESEASATLVPAGALFTDQDSGALHVFVKDGAGWARRPVEVGLRNFVEAAIRSGVRAGEVVAQDWPLARPATAPKT